MDFGIVRLSSEWPGAKLYHLYDKKGKLRVVADHGTPWLPVDPQQHVRFARPSGDLVATMDLTWLPKQQRNGRHHVAYAIIIDHAVYAILNKYWDGNDNQAAPYFVLEAGEELWLALDKPHEDRHYTLYDEVPSDLMITSDPQQSQLPEPIGYLYQGLGEYDYNIVFPTEQLQHPALVSLALIFLIDYGRF
ncbi:MAG: hypothetical protein KC419_13725 [Anaerolineales bacterium]|nr:hypothetical protein [Anaerolineales bacterium]